MRRVRAGARLTIGAGILLAGAGCARAAPHPPSPGLVGRGLPSGRYAHGLVNSVAAAGPRDVWAVGAIQRSPRCRMQWLALHWDGHRWIDVPSPDLAAPCRRRGPGANDVLNAVSVVSARSAWAVGDAYRSAGPLVPLVLHWDGSQWRRLPARWLPRGACVLVVAAARGGGVWIGGQAVVHRREVPFITHRGARGWATTWLATAFAALPHPGLTAIVATGPDRAWGAGSAATSFAIPTDRALALRGQGRRWRAVPITGLSLGPFGSLLLAASATSSSDVWMVGATGIDPHPSRPLALRWNGRRWRRAPVPGVRRGWIAAIAMATPGSGFAVVDNQGLQPGIGQTTLWRWDGHTWLHTPTARLPGRYDLLDTVVSPSPTEAWAFGEYRPAGTRPGTSHILVLRWDGKRWSVAS